jgi:cytochrome c-type biogenesis protein CcmH/NrfG
MGRKWCPGSTEFDYVYRNGYLYPVIEQQQGSTQEHGREEPASEATASPAAADRLAEATRLHDQGLLTDEEYQAKRAEIISGL